ncbi:cobalamin biosynthesis protein CobN [Ventosimonas gracilis]|uniref:Cobalamin biosynthesis protein CobN n=1 Tax=Ventosimonas gracilis TaxID=1680762 RepID=A0A139SIU2_9GAMM|nr:cobaltochelatase subunit CobN [Ventosimonas gracilis]KXU34456.1 cobalamin biosynthesis protein CobN [Ventosimonas gracilis]
MLRGIFALPLILLLYISAALADKPLQVAVITNDFVLPGKVRTLDTLSQEQGVRFTHIPLIEAAKQPLLADLILLDTPRPSDAAELQAQLAEQLAQSRTPWLGIGGGPLRFAHLPAADARAIAAYYQAGGKNNWQTLARWLVRWRNGENNEDLPPPTPLPKTGYYQGGQVFAKALDYQQWLSAHGKSSAPKVAVIIAPSLVSGMRTAVLDALIERAAAYGVEVFGLWFDGSTDNALQQALDGLTVDALVNMTHLQNGEKRSKELAALNIPLLQTLSSRDPPDDWRAAKSGVSPGLAAVFMASAETIGMSDPLVISAIEQGEAVALPEQIDLLAAKLLKLAALRHKPAADKKLAVLFWNYPAGEKNLSASHLNVPRSLALLSERLQQAAYSLEPISEEALIAAGQALLGGYYRMESLDDLYQRNLAAAFTVKQYRAWLDRLPAARRQEILKRWGEPEQHPAVRVINGEPSFLIPRLQLGNLLIMPQPPRAERVSEATHDTKSVPNHYYLAVYQFLREGFQADALIHFGTHGSQEWTPGKDRGLHAYDYPMLTAADLPIFYPYIQDNVGEAIQAKRRGRAITISHQTPALAPAGLYDELRDLHEQMHHYQQLSDGKVREKTAAELIAHATRAGITADMGWSEEAIALETDSFINSLHDHLHELARRAIPLGLHSFGQSAAPEHRLSTVMQQLGEPYYQLLGLDASEVFAEDFNALQQSPAYRFLQRYLRENAPLHEIENPLLRELIERAQTLDVHLAETGEIEALLNGLGGGHVRPGAGGDPVRSPDVQSGRDLFAFEADKIPLRAAFTSGEQALAQLLKSYQAEHNGELPKKLAFSLWSSEAIRHLGVTESQALHALGLRPVWDSGGRLTALDIIPREALGRARIDVVLHVTSVYRDQFDGFMRLLAGAIERLAELDEEDNPIAANSRLIAEKLAQNGISAEQAKRLSRLRLFSAAPGEYGSGLSHQVLAEKDRAGHAHADKSDAALAGQFLSRLQYGYGANDWGVSHETNLLAEQLRGTQVAVLSRSSNIHGMLSTDHPFEFLGGLSLSIRHLDGKSPALYVSDLRSSTGKTHSAQAFIAAELRSQYLNPHWISQMQHEGYAGTLSILNAVNNLFGWQVTDPSTVREAQWQALHDTYIRDVRELGLNDWFEQHNRTAQMQLIERLQETIERGYWQADEQVSLELAERLQALSQQSADSGYGVDSPAFAPEQATAPTETVQGKVLEKQESFAEPRAPDWQRWLGYLILVLLVMAGAFRQVFYSYRLREMHR